MYLFHVISCQSKRLEVAIGDPRDLFGQLVDDTATRFLVKPNAHFHVPALNTFRIENHSNAMDCVPTYTIIDPSRKSRRVQKPAPLR